MHEAIEILESYGLIKDTDSLHVREIVKGKVGRLHEELYATILARQQKDYYAGIHNSQLERGLDPFTFVASRSLRGESACGAYGCRLEKVDELGRYAALYATQVILPLQLRDPSRVEDASQSVLDLSRASLALLHLRPLVDAGVIYPVVMRSFQCEHTIRWFEKMTSIVYDAVDHMRDAVKDEFLVRYQLPEKAPQHCPSIYVEGPDDFLEHGSVVEYFDERKGWRLKSWRFDNEGMVELRGSRKNGALNPIFHGIAEDTTFYLAYGRYRDARLLTDLPGETYLLNDLTTDDRVSANSAALNEYMNHTLPLLGDLSIATLLGIRREERESFGRYQIAIQKILVDVAQNRRMSKKAAKEVFQTSVEPELRRMKSELYAEQTRQRRRMTRGLGLLAASVALGAFGGIVPALAKLGAAAAGVATGTRLLYKAAESSCDHGATVREKNDFYFLLRLTQEAES